MSGDDRAAASAHDESRFRAIFASEPECVKLIGPDYRLNDMNPAGLRMIEAVSIESVRGCNLFDLIDPAYHLAFRDAVDAAFQGAASQVQFEVVGLRGRRLWMDQSAAPLFDPIDPTRVVEVVAVTRDITVQRKADAELLRAKLSEAINRSRSEFLAQISHELKTPLNHIIGYSELLQETALEQGRLNDAADHQHVLDGAAHLLSMIKQMISISMADAEEHKVSVDKCDINELIDVAVAAVKSSADSSRNEILVEACDESGLWACDGPKLDHCLRNLLSNAVKFTRDGVIRVRATREIVDGLSWLRLEITDTGIGIEESQLGKLFHPFVLTDPSATRQHQGVGLGLAVTRQLAQLMGGDVTVTSAPGQGSRFTLRVPAEFASETTSMAPRSRSA